MHIPQQTDIIEKTYSKYSLLNLLTENHLLQISYYKHQRKISNLQFLFVNFAFRFVFKKKKSCRKSDSLILFVSQP